MSEFDINLQKIKNLLEGNRGIPRELGTISDEIRSVGSNLGIQSSAGKDIKRRMKRVAEDVQAEKQKIMGYNQALSAISGLYEKTEISICGAASDGKITLREKVEQVIGNIFEHGGGIFRNIAIGPAQTVADLLISTEVDVLHGEGKLKIVVPKGKSELYNSKDDFKTSTKKQTLIESETDPVTGERKQTKKNVEQGSEEERKFDSKPVKKVATILGVSGSLEGSLVDINSELSNEYGKIKNRTTVGKAEIHGSAYAGLYTVGKDGQKRFTPGLGAEIGGSVTAFSDEAEAVLGGEYNNVYVKGSVTAGKAEAKAGVDVGLYDKDGKFNPSASVNASAEAIAASASAAVGGTIMGTKVEGNVGVTAGVGAHAKIGIKDGTISLDLGAAIGVGVSANLEIDMSGTFKWIGSKVESFAKSVGWWN